MMEYVSMYLKRLALAGTCIAVIAGSVNSIAPAHALGLTATLTEWAFASPSERSNLAALYGRVMRDLNVAVSANEIEACIDQVASGSALRAQKVDDVAKACALMIVQQK
jgi:hypothetical protein